MNDYDRNGTTLEDGKISCYGAISDLDATTQELTLSKDHSFTFAIDQLDADETNQTLQASAALERQQREVVVPEIDTYAFGKITTGAGHKPDAKELTSSNIYEEIIKANAVLDNDMVSEAGRVLIVTPDTYLLMKKCSDIVMNTDIGEEMRVKASHPIWMVSRL